MVWNGHGGRNFAGPHSRHAGPRGLSALDVVIEAGHLPPTSGPAEYAQWLRQPVDDIVNNLVQTIDSRIAFAIAPTLQEAQGYVTQAEAARDAALGYRDEASAIVAGVQAQVDAAEAAAAQAQAAADFVASGVLAHGAILDLTLSNTIGSETHKITMNVGQCRSSDNTTDIAVTVPLVKSILNPWEEANEGGGRIGGAVATKQTWHVFVCLNPTTDAVNMFFHQSATNPAPPAGYTKWRRIGSILIDPSVVEIRRFVQRGDFFSLRRHIPDYAAVANGFNGYTGAYLRRVSVPEGIVVEGRFYYASNSHGGFGTPSSPGTSGIYDPAHGVPTGIGAWGQIRFWNNNNLDGRFQVEVIDQFTDTAAQVYTTSNDPSDQIQIGVLGWRDERGRFY